MLEEREDLGGGRQIESETQVPRHRGGALRLELRMGARETRRWRRQRHSQQRHQHPYWAHCHVRLPGPFPDRRETPLL